MSGPVDPPVANVARLVVARPLRDATPTVTRRLIYFEWPFEMRMPGGKGEGTIGHPGRLDAACAAIACARLWGPTCEVDWNCARFGCNVVWVNHLREKG